MCELHPGPRYSLNDAVPASYFDLHMVPLDTNQEERVTAGTWRSIASMTGGLMCALVCRLGCGI